MKKTIQIRSISNEIIYEHTCENNTIKKTVECAIRNKANLRGANLSGQFLYDIDFSGISLMYADFTKSTLTRSKFIRTSLYMSNFANATISKCDFSKSNISRSTLTDVTALEADFYRVNFSHSNLSNGNFSESNMAQVNFSNTNMTNSTLDSSDLFGAYFENSNLSRVDVSKFDISTANIFNVDFSEAIYSIDNKKIVIKKALFLSNFSKYPVHVIISKEKQYYVKFNDKIINVSDINYRYIDKHNLHFVLKTAQNWINENKI